MKKKKYRRKVLVITVLLAISIGIFYLLFMRGNVLDEISKEAKSAKKANFKDFNNVKELEGLERDDLYQFEFFGELSIPYKKEYLKENIEVELTFPEKGDIIGVSGYITIADSTLLIIEMGYDPNNKTMTYEPIHISDWTEDEVPIHYYGAENVNKYLAEYNITKEDVTQYQTYILYDVVIKTWVEANGVNFETARKKMEKCKLINNTFVFPEKDEISK